jgi:hypothetical protein
MIYIELYSFLITLDVLNAPLAHQVVCLHVVHSQ